MAITHVRVTGQHHTSPQHLVATIQPLATGNFFAVDRQALRVALLTAVPLLKEVQIDHVWPHTLQISLQEYQPLAQFHSTLAPSPAADTSIMVDAQGLPVTLQGTLSNELARLPRLRGPHNCLPLLVKQYLKLTLLLQRVGLKIAELQCHATYAWTAILNNRLTLLLGRDQSDRRIQRFMKKLSFIQQLNFYPSLTIDLRYSNGMAVKKTEELNSNNVTLPRELSFSGSHEVIYAS